MDVVKKNLDRIGGTVDIQTELNQGTTIKIRIPITLAIIPVLIVMIGHKKFAIPQVNLEKLIMVQEVVKRLVPSKKSMVQKCIACEDNYCLSCV